MSKSQGINAGNTDEAFQKLQEVQELFCERERICHHDTLGFLTFKTFYMYRNLCDTLQEGKKLRKQKRSPLTTKCILQDS